ncbi:hypothetical protein IJH02_02110, partial [Candidatus Saccharibacteria bacterium]|nr:hypothetical protein [Candidatus Saccharibacteria bacterium]
MKNTRKNLMTAGLTASLGLSAFAAAVMAPGAFAATSTNGNTRVEMEVATSIAMKIVSPNDTDPDCLAESGVTYGVVNRYAYSNGEGGKVVDTFDGREGQKDEINTNTSCAKLNMTPNTFDSTYSDVTVYTNSGTGYAISVQPVGGSAALLNVNDNTSTIPAGVLVENNGTVSGGQNLWSYKTDNGIQQTWSAMGTSATTIKSYDTETSGGETTRVTYGVSTGNNATGTYVGSLTYTATMFDGSSNPYVSDVAIPAVANLIANTDNLSIPFGHAANVTVTPAEGYYLSGVTCPTGFTCTGYSTDIPTTYPAGSQTITVTNGNTNTTGTLALTVSPLSLSNISTMQEMSPAIVQGTATGASKSLADTRGGSYTVTKLADNNIWMTQDLKLGGSAAVALDSTNSDLPSGASYTL